MLLPSWLKNYSQLWRRSAARRRKLNRLVLERLEDRVVPANFTALPPVEVGHNPVASVTGHFEDNGNVDIAVANLNEATVTILSTHTNSDGSVTVLPLFTLKLPQQAGHGILNTLAVTDVNHDGKDDLIVADPEDKTITAYISKGTDINGHFLGFAAQAQLRLTNKIVVPSQLVVGHFITADIYPDVAVLPDSGSNLITILQDTNGSLVPGPSAAIPGGFAPNASVAGDFDGDHVLDLAMPGTDGNTYVLLGDGLGGFTTSQVIATAPSGGYNVGIAAGDINGDGRVDLAVLTAIADGSGHRASSVVVLKNGVDVATGKPSFTAFSSNPLAVGDTALGMVLGQFGGSANFGLAVTNLSPGSVTIYMGDRTGKFTAAGAADPVAKSGLLVAADFNNDGFLDLAVTGQDSGQNLQGLETVLLGHTISVTTLTVDPTANPSVTGDPVTFKFHVALGDGVASDGTVTLLDTQTNQTFVTTNPWSHGNNTITLTPDPSAQNAPLADGVHHFSASYSGSTTGIVASAPVLFDQQVRASTATVLSQVEYQAKLGLVPDTTTPAWTLAQEHGGNSDVFIEPALQALQITDPGTPNHLYYTLAAADLNASIAAFVEATFEVRRDTTIQTSGVGAVGFGFADGAHRIELDFDHYVNGYNSDAVYTLATASGPAQQLTITNADEFHIMRVAKDASGNVAVQITDASGNGAVSLAKVAASLLPADTGPRQFFFGANPADGHSVSDWQRVRGWVGRTDDNVTAKAINTHPSLEILNGAHTSAVRAAVSSAAADAVQTFATGGTITFHVHLPPNTPAPSLSLSMGMGNDSNHPTSPAQHFWLYADTQSSAGTDFFYPLPLLNSEQLKDNSGGPSALGVAEVQVVGDDSDHTVIEPLTTRFIVADGAGSVQTTPPQLTIQAPANLARDNNGYYIVSPGQVVDFVATATQADGHLLDLYTGNDNDPRLVTAIDAERQNAATLVEGAGAHGVALYARFTAAVPRDFNENETVSFNVVDKAGLGSTSDSITFSVSRPDPYASAVPQLNLTLSAKNLPSPLALPLGINHDVRLLLTVQRTDVDRPLAGIPKIYYLRDGWTAPQEFTQGFQRTYQDGKDWVTEVTFTTGDTSVADLGNYTFFAEGIDFFNHLAGQSVRMPFYLGSAVSVFADPKVITNTAAATGDLTTTALGLTTVAGPPVPYPVEGDFFAVRLKNGLVVTGVISRGSGNYVDPVTHEVISRGSGNFILKDAATGKLISEDLSGLLGNSSGNLIDPDGFIISAQVISRGSGNFQDGRYLATLLSDGHRFFGLNSAVAPNGIVAPGAAGNLVLTESSFSSLLLPDGHLIAPGASGRLTFDNNAVAMQRVDFAATEVSRIEVQQGFSAAATQQSTFFQPSQDIVGPGRQFTVRAAAASSAASPTPDGAALDTLLRSQFLLWHAELLRLNGQSAAAVQARVQEAADLLDAGQAVLGPQGFGGLTAAQLAVLQRAAHVVKLAVAPATPGHSLAPGALVVLTPLDPADTLATGSAAATAGQPLPLTLAGTLVTAGGNLAQPMQTGSSVLPLQLYGRPVQLVSAAPGRVEIRLPADLRTDRPQLIVLTTADGQVGMVLIQPQVADFLPKNTGKFSDTDGDTYTVTLTGPGKVGVVLDDPTGSGKGPLDRIVVQGTDPAKSSLSVTVVKGKLGDGRVSIGSITGTGLQSIAIGASDLVGSGIALSGLLGALTVHDLRGTTQVRAGGTVLQNTTIAAHVVEAGAVINLGSWITSLGAAAVQGGSITAAGLGNLNVNGDAQNKVNGVLTPLAGNFNAALTLGGKPLTATTLGGATIAGGIAAAVWNITGDTGPVTVRGAVTSWQANLHGKAAGLTLGAVGSATVVVDKAIATLSAKGWTAGSLTAASIGTLAITGDLGASVTLTGVGLAARTPALGSATVSGTVNGSILRSAGTVNSFSAAAFVGSELLIGFVPTDPANPLGGGTFTPGLKLGSFTVTGLPHSSAPAFVNSTVAAAAVGTVTLKSVQTANGGKKFGVIAHTAPGAVTVTTPAFKYNQKGPAAQGVADFEVTIL